MRTLSLQITAELYGITELKPADGISSEETNYFFKLRCESCGELREPEVCVRLGETIAVTYMVKEIEVHLFTKCKHCRREGIIYMDPDATAYGLTDMLSRGGYWAPLMQFDCEGLMPEDFSFAGTWLATTVEGREIAIDSLDDGEFVEESTGYFVRNPRAKFQPVF